MIESMTFPTDLTTLAAVAGMSGALVVIVYAFQRNHKYVMRKRSARIRKTHQSEVDLPPQIG